MRAPRRSSLQDFAQPKLVQELWERSTTIRLVDCSDNVSIAVTSAGDVYTWGDGKKSGVLGQGKVLRRSRHSRLWVQFFVLSPSSLGSASRFVDGGPLLDPTQGRLLYAEHPHRDSQRGPVSLCRRLEARRPLHMG